MILLIQPFKLELRNLPSHPQSISHFASFPNFYESQILLDIFIATNADAILLLQHPPPFNLFLQKIQFVPSKIRKPFTNPRKLIISYRNLSQTYQETSVTFPANFSELKRSNDLRKIDTTIILPSIFPLLK
jgi:hypothetical protein